MSNATQPLANRPTKSRFLERWAYWMIGLVVLMGFVNAKWPEFFSSLVVREPENADTPVIVDRHDIKFTSTALEHAFNQVEQEMIRRAGKKNWLYKCDRYVVQMTVAHNKFVLPISRTELSLIAINRNPVTVNEIYSTSESDRFQLYISLSDAGSRLGHTQANLQFGISDKASPTDTAADDLLNYHFPAYFLSMPIIYQGSEYEAQVSRPAPLPLNYFVSIINSPETFLETALAQEDAILASARIASESDNLIFNGFGETTAPIGLVLPLSPETIDEIELLVFDKLQERRKYLIEHHREMYDLLMITPLSKETAEAYGAYLDSK